MTDTELRKPGRPRNAQADEAILKAALELIAQDGVQGMTLEGVAARAGVSKTTIYRRWASRDELIVEALRRIKVPAVNFDTGNFRGDITQFLHSVLSLLDDPLMQRVSLRILGEIAARPDWAQKIFQDTVATNFDGLYGMIERARDRGELRPDADTLLVMEVLGGPLVYHFVIAPFVAPFLPNQQAFSIERLVDLVWEGLATVTTERLPVRLQEAPGPTPGSPPEAGSRTER